MPRVGIGFTLALVVSLVLMATTRADVPRAWAGTGGDLQSFALADINIATCFNAQPTGGSLTCPTTPTDSRNIAQPGSEVFAYEFVDIPKGSREAITVSYTPSDWIFHPGYTWGSIDATEGGLTAQYGTSITFQSTCGSTATVASTGSSLAWPDPTWEFEKYASRTLSAIGSHIGEIKPTPPDFRPLAFQRVDFLKAWGFGGYTSFSPVVQFHEVVEEWPSHPGLTITTGILGNRSQLPTNSYTCHDSPARRVVSKRQWTAPSAPGYYPIWTILTSNPDLRSSAVSRILILQCVEVGAPTTSDADDDCLADDIDPFPSVADTDGDLLLDGVEEAFGSHPGNADADADGADDFDELAQFTDPYNPDTDGDGSLDKADTGAKEDTQFDTSADDNCPAVYNPDQLNTDAKNEYHGGGVLTGDQQSLGNPSADATNPDEDPLGDACDADDDNDGLTDLQEEEMTIVPWTGFSGAGVTVCRGASVGAPPATPLDPKDGDSDDDLILDGVECRMSSRPDVAFTSIASCALTPVDPDGCAQPATTGWDQIDADLLYVPGLTGTTGNNLAESFYRTINISQSTGSTSDTDGDGNAGSSDQDSDDDYRHTSLATPPAGGQVRLRDGTEGLYYGTSPVNRDTDGDGCSDGHEVADINGTRKVDSGDQLLLASAMNAGQNLDTNQDGEVDDMARINFDLNKDAKVNGGDQLFMAWFISTNCKFAVEQGITISKAAK